MNVCLSSFDDYFTYNSEYHRMYTTSNGAYKSPPPDNRNILRLVSIKSSDQVKLGRIHLMFKTRIFVKTLRFQSFRTHNLI